MPFNYLPGTQAFTVDGGLAVRRVPRTKKTLVIGTAAKGPADNPYPVLDRGDAANAFGLSGNLVRASEEVAAGGNDNVILYRMGTQPATLSGIGKEFATAKTITNVARTSGVAVVTSNAHGYLLGDTVKVAAVTNVSINGEVVLTAVSPNTFSFASTGADIVSGADTGSAYKLLAAGVSIAFGERTADAVTRYQVWFKLGVLYVWLDGQLVYANDVANSVVLDTNNIIVTGTFSANGLQLGTGASGLLSASVTLTAAAALSGSATTPTPALVAAVTGIGLTARQSYIALAKALELLDIFPVDQVVLGDGLYIDNPNVAYYVAGDPTTAANNPATNVNALDWLKTSVDSVGNKTYQWASETVDSNGATVAAMSGVSTPAQRIAAGFYEAHFEYLLANFCQRQEQSVGSCVGFIGATPPAGFGLSVIRSWVGFLPTYDLIIDGKVTVPGKGLLGIPVLAGTTSAKLNPLCSDYAIGWRVPGLFKTNEEQFDGSIVLDKNNNKVDIGAYLHVQADIAVQSNGFALNYGGNIAGYTAGFVSNMDEKSNLTNKPANLIQLWKATQGQLDSLTRIGVNVLRFKGDGQLPAFLHGQTGATNISDYKNLLRQRVKGLVVRVIRNVAEKYIGESSIDGLQLEALKTDLEGRLLELQKRGYMSKYSFNVTTNLADQRIGHANIDVTFNPADELIQLTANVGVSRR
jgi:hypothetical protein